MRASRWDGATALVTGGAGFIGSHLVEALTARGARVRVLDDLSTGCEKNLPDRGGDVDLLRGDIRDADTCRRSVEGMEFIFHQAALGSVPRSLEDPASTVAVNVAGTANVFAAARAGGARRVVFASSSSVYGDSTALPKVEGEEGMPLSPYAASKKMAEQLAETFARAYRLELVGLRYFNVYGPRQPPDGPYAAVVPRFFAAALGGSPQVIYGDGEQSRDFTAVEDAVQANLLAATAPARACGRSYNVGGGGRVSISALARQIAAICGSDVPPRHAEPRPGDVRHSQADLDRARRFLGYDPAVALAAGLERCVGYYRELFAGGSS